MRNRHNAETEKINNCCHFHRLNRELSDYDKENASNQLIKQRRERKMLKTFDYFSTTIKMRCVIGSKSFHHWMLRIVLHNNWLDLCMIDRLHHLHVGDLSLVAEKGGFDGFGKVFMCRDCESVDWRGSEDTTRLCRKVSLRKVLSIEDIALFPCTHPIQELSHLLNPSNHNLKTAYQQESWTETLRTNHAEFYYFFSH